MRRRDSAPPAAGAMFGFDYDERLDYEATLLRLMVASQIESVLTHNNVQAKELAQRMGRSKSWVSRVLSGTQNATLDTLAEVALALGLRWHPSLVATNRAGTPAASDVEPPNWVHKRAPVAEVWTTPRLEVLNVGQQSRLVRQKNNYSQIHLYQASSKRAFVGRKQSSPYENIIGSFNDKDAMRRLSLVSTPRES